MCMPPACKGSISGMCRGLQACSTSARSQGPLTHPQAPHHHHHAAAVRAATPQPRPAVWPPYGALPPRPHARRARRLCPPGTAHLSALLPPEPPHGPALPHHQHRARPRPQHPCQLRRPPRSRHHRRRLAPGRAEQLGCDRGHRRQATADAACARGPPHHRQVSCRAGLTTRKHKRACAQRPSSAWPALSSRSAPAVAAAAPAHACVSECTRLCEE